METYRLARPVTPVRAVTDQTAYWTYGDGPLPVVFVHGLRGTHEGLSLIAQDLVAQSPGYRVIVPDLPGFGESGKAPDHGSVTGYAQWLKSFYADLSLGDAPLVAHSFGTIISAAAIATGLSPERVVFINAIASSPLHGAIIGTRITQAYYKTAEMLPESAGRAFLSNRVIVRGMSMVMAKTHDRALRKWIHHQHDQYFSDFTDVASVVGAFDTSISADVSEFANRIDMPVLLIAGSKDDITHLSEQQQLRARLPKAVLNVYRGVGHLVHYEAHKRAAGDILEFLEDQDN